MILFQSQGFFKIVTTNPSPPPKKKSPKRRPEKKKNLTIFVHAFYIYKCSPTIYIQMGTGIGAYYLEKKKKKKWLDYIKFIYMIYKIYKATMYIPMYKRYYITWTGLYQHFFVI